jgi:hypothetical protein
MKVLDSGSLFSIFEQADEEVFKEGGVDTVLDNDFLLLGTVIKGVENYYIIDQLYSFRYGEQYFSTRESIKLKYFTGLIRYMERINEIQSDTLLALKEELGIQSINYALQELLSFFEEVEQYEHCARIFKYIELFSLKELIVR